MVPRKRLASLSLFLSSAFRSSLLQRSPCGKKQLWSGYCPKGEGRVQPKSNACEDTREGGDKAIGTMFKLDLFFPHSTWLGSSASFITFLPICQLKFDKNFFTNQSNLAAFPKKQKYCNYFLREAICTKKMGCIHCVQGVGREGGFILIHNFLKYKVTHYKL